MYRCGSCGKTFQKRSKKCPSCKSEGITLVPDRGGGGSLGAIVGFLLLCGAAAATLAFLGFINIPGITPERSKPEVGRLKPPAADAERKNDDAKPLPEASPDARNLAPSPTTPAAPVESKPLYPPVKASDLEKARALYARGDFAGAAKALDACERDGVAPGDTTTEARALSRKARILDAVTKKIPKSPLATAAKLEQIAIEGAGSVMGVVTDAGDKLTVVAIGGITTTIDKEKVADRTPVDRATLVEKLRARLKDKESRLKGDDALGLFRLGHYCWQYALTDDSVAYFDKAVQSDDFPVVARVFGPTDARDLVKAWSELTGKPIPGAPPKETVEVASSKTPGKMPSPSPDAPAASASGDVVAQARAKYEQGLAKYRLSFGDTPEAQAAHEAAFKLFKQARDLLNQAGDDPKLDDLRMDISRVLEDCRKRPGL